MATIITDFCSKEILHVCFTVLLSVNLSLFLYCLLSWNNGWSSRYGGLWGPWRKWHQSCWRDSQHGPGSGQCLPQFQDPPQAQHTAKDPCRHPLRYCGHLIISTISQIIRTRTVYHVSTEPCFSPKKKKQQKNPPHLVWRLKAVQSMTTSS